MTRDISSADKSIYVDALIAGDAEGDLLHSNVGLSFWGGVDPIAGLVIDHHHPLAGMSLAGRILAIPQGRGSCTGSGILLELALNGHAPAAIVVCDTEEILTLGSVVAKVMFNRSVPICRVERNEFDRLDQYSYGWIEGGRLHLFASDRAATSTGSATGSAQSAARIPLQLDVIDREMLAGHHGKACEVAMRLLVRMAEIQGACELMDVSQVHIDGCCYNGPGGLRLAQMLVEWGGRVRVPTTLNSISVDRRRWRELGVSEAWGNPADALADAYLAIGAQPTFTCAPYMLDTAPKFGDQIGWAESNAVVYANSVLGARTLKYPDYLDVCIALTGRAPRTGCHLDEGRKATVVVNVIFPSDADDSFWPLLGYCCGSLCGREIPLIRGLEKSGAGADELKAFGAAFATVAAAPMFHIAGITPEADGQEPQRILSIDVADLAKVWETLNTANDTEIGLISLGNPHFSLSEFARFAKLVSGRVRSAKVEVVITCGRQIHQAAAAAGYVEAAQRFGATIVTDTCWCMLSEPVVPPNAEALMTNSGKYAHYAPGLVGRKVRFGNLSDCIEAACAGFSQRVPPAWLERH